VGSNTTVITHEAQAPSNIVCTTYKGAARNADQDIPGLPLLRRAYLQINAMHQVAMFGKHVISRSRIRISYLAGRSIAVNIAFTMCVVYTPPVGP
jgi:hypothetical protein